MIRVPGLFAALAVLVACGPMQRDASAPGDPAVPVREAGEEDVNPRARPGSPGPDSADTLDTASAEDRRRAADESGAAGLDLGTTIASLGSVSQQGFWLRTPLVDAPATGRITYLANGISATVDLIPLEAERGAGSRISLSAMKLIGADLAGLPEIRVVQLSD